MAIPLAALVFGLYHIPYAYFNPHWPSHGDLSAALVSALTQGGVAGLILGAVYAKSRNNLLAAVLLHALIDVFPATVQIRIA